MALERIETFIRDFLASLQTAKLYAVAHPIFKKSAQKTHQSLQDILQERDELAIGIIGDELAFEKEIFFDLSRQVRQAVFYLKERGIERDRAFESGDFGLTIEGEVGVGVSKQDRERPR